MTTANLTSDEMEEKANEIDMSKDSLEDAISSLEDALRGTGLGQDILDALKAIKVGRLSKVVDKLNAEAEKARDAEYEAEEAEEA